MNDKKKTPFELAISSKNNDKTSIVKSNTLNYPSMFNAGQINALTVMVDWSKTTNDAIKVMEGPAGTGKTTVLDSFIKNLNTGNVVITAPTHKAVRIASTMTSLKGETIQKLLGLRPNYNVEKFDINNIKFDPLGKKSISNYRLIIIDEASMINKSLKSYLEREANVHGTKILYVGDPYQLPPIKEKSSSVFYIKPIHKVILKEVVRQGDNNSISDLLVTIRKSIKNRDYKYIDYIIANPNSISNSKGFMLVSDEARFGGMMQKAFNDKRLERNIDWCKYVAYTKLNVLHWNMFIRHSIFPDQTVALHKNDLLMAHNTIIDEFNNPKITNSEDYVIKDIEPNYRNRYGIMGYNVNFTSVHNGKVTPYMFVVEPEETNIARFLHLATERLRDAYSKPLGRRGKYFKEYFEFKDQHLLLQDIPKSDGNPYGINKDLDYGFGLTIHKSQGSTFNNVFVNLRNIVYGNTDKPNSDIDMVNRLFYVAASRAKENLIILW